MNVHVIRFLYNLYIEMFSDDIETEYVRQFYYCIVIDLNSRYMLDRLSIFNADDLEDYLSTYARVYDR